MNSLDQKYAYLLLITVLLLLKKKQLMLMDTPRFRQPKRFGVHPLLQVRKEQGCYNNLLMEARLSDPYIFYNFTRMTSESFDKLLGIVGPFITKASHREPISAGCRLAVTLRFLATGDSYPSLSYSFRIGVPTICNIVRETCAILWNKLHPIVIPLQTTEQLQNIADGFLKKWSLPNCVGAIDGKHVTIQAPHNSGSVFFNYKKNFSVVLLGVCDADYNFLYVDIGAYGSQSDGGVLQQSLFGRKLFQHELNLPEPRELPYCPLNIKIPFFFVGDEAFPLKENLMRPFSRPRAGALSRDEKIYNYRLSRARRVIENTFGIMVARFRILHRVINANPSTVDNILKAIVCLHNYIRKENIPFYVTKGDMDKEIGGGLTSGRWRTEIPREGLALANIPLRLGARNATFTALAIRNHLKNYVNGPGAVLAPWQWDTINRAI